MEDNRYNEDTMEMWLKRRSNMTTLTKGFVRFMDFFFHTGADIDGISTFYFFILQSHSVNNVINRDVIFPLMVY